jgi:hypothetical protein
LQRPWSCRPVDQRLTLAARDPSIFWTADNDRIEAEMTAQRKSDRARYIAKDRYRLRHFTFGNSHLASTYVNALTKGLQQEHILRDEQQAERQHPQTQVR